MRLENPERTRRKAGQAVMTRLKELVELVAAKEAEAAALQKEVNKLLNEAKAAKNEIVELNVKYEFAERSGKSEKVEFDSGVRVRTTRTDYAPKLDAGRLRRNIKNDSVFFKVITVKACDLNVNEWRDALDQELVTESMLKDALDERAPSISVKVEGA